MNHSFRIAGCLLALAAGQAAAQQVVINASGGSAQHRTASSYQKVRLIVTGPQGKVSEQTLQGAGINTFQIDARQLADGEYGYRLDFTAAGAATAADPRLPIDASGRAQSVRAGSAAPPSASGSFVVRGGVAHFPQAPTHAGDTDLPRDKSVLPQPTPKDQVIADDLIVQGSTCIGLDCVNNESFGFDTIRMKENNTRIKFEDTSTGDFPSVDWTLSANDSPAFGVNRFWIEDATNLTKPFFVEAATPDNTLYIDSTANIGFGTQTPLLDLHLVTGDTPAHRFEQTNANGFTAQTWDVAGNEANFFVRDLTAGSRLPFRIRPGAPTSSIDISATGNVGIGLSAPDAKLHIDKTVPADMPESMLRVTNPTFNSTQPVRFDVDSNGNVSARGTISQLSSRSAKEGFETIDGAALLQKVDALPIGTWRYIAASDRHLGPVAEDFHEAFGLGATDKMIAPSDLAGVALAAVKALQDQLQQRDRQIEALEARLARIEAQNAR